MGSNLYTLLAAQAADSAPAGGTGPDMIWLFLIIGAAFYFIILRPQRKEQKEREAAISEIKKGTKIISAGGIHGVVVDANDKDTLLVEVDKNKGVRMRFNRASISVVQTNEKKDEAAKK